MRFPEMHEMGNRFGAAIVTFRATARNFAPRQSLKYYPNTFRLQKRKTHFLVFARNVTIVTFGATSGDQGCAGSRETLLQLLQIDFPFYAFREIAFRCSVVTPDAIPGVH